MEIESGDSPREIVPAGPFGAYSRRLFHGATSRALHKLARVSGLLWPKGTLIFFAAPLLEVNQPLRVPAIDLLLDFRRQLHELRQESVLPDVLPRAEVVGPEEDSV